MPTKVKQTEARSLPGTTYVEPGVIDWQAAGDKCWTKLLREDPARRERTLLMKLEPGAAFPPHAHDEVEQIFVISGSFYDQERVLRVGDYACRAPGAVHTAASDHGALVLLVYSPA